MKGDALPLIYRFLFCLIFFLSGCTIKPTSDSQVNVHFIAAPDINKNKKGEPSPVQIFIYQVNNRDNFSAENPLSLMSSTLPKTHQDYRRIGEIILQPGQQKTLSLPITTGRNTLAYVAAFRHIATNQWSVIHTVENPAQFIWQKVLGGRSLQHTLRLQASTLTLSEQGTL